MAYSVFDNSSTTLTPAEASAEAKRILSRLSGRDLIGSGVTENGVNFVSRLQREMLAAGSVNVSLRELWYLRDISEKVD